MSKDFKDLTKEQLIEYINELRKQLNNEKYGLYFDRKVTPEDIVNECKTKIPILEREYELDINNGGLENIMIEGDNFQVLTALNLINDGNGIIDLIYIDPPYNTGQKDFIYNDSFVSKDDPYYHTTWLNFMEKRLVLARDILKETGVIFISIDEHEFAQLKLLCDSIFGESNFIENFIWIKNSTKNLSKTTSTNHEYVLSYAKNIEIIRDIELFRVAKPGIKEVFELLKKANNEGRSPDYAEKQLKKFYKENKDLKGISSYDRVDFGPSGGAELRAFTLSDLSAPKSTGRGHTYEILHPTTNKPCKIPSRGWLYTEEVMKEHIKNGYVYFYNDETKVPRYKRYLETVKTDVRKSIITDFTDGKKELQKIFKTAPFDNAKPTTLIKDLISTFPKDVIVLDFFAGSGTTGHAVIDLNKEDSGNRRFILCTNNENNIMSQVCYPRIKSVINGKNYNGEFMHDPSDDVSLRFFKAGFIEDNISKDQAKYNLIEKSDGLLSLKENIFDKVAQGKNFNIYSNNSTNRLMSIYNNYFDEKTFNEMLDKIKNLNHKENIIYYFSLDNNVDEALEEKVISKINGSVVKPIPSKIYEIYKRISDDIKREY